MPPTSRPHTLRVLRIATELLLVMVKHPQGCAVGRYGGEPFQSLNILPKIPFRNGLRYQPGSPLPPEVQPFTAVGPFVQPVVARPPVVQSPVSALPATQSPAPLASSPRGTTTGASYLGFVLFSLSDMARPPFPERSSAMMTDYEPVYCSNNGSITSKLFNDIFGTFGPDKGLVIFVITADVWLDDSHRTHCKSLHRYRPATGIRRALPVSIHANIGYLPAKRSLMQINRRDERAGHIQIGGESEGGPRMSGSGWKAVEKLLPDTSVHRTMTPSRRGGVFQLP